MKTIYITLLFLLLQNQLIIAADQSALFWQPIERSQCRFQPDEMIAVKQAQYLQLDINGMRTFMSSAPMQTKQLTVTSLIMQVPMPDGSFSRFAVMETQVMHPALAAKYTMIKTYSGQGLDDKSLTIIIDITQMGFHAMILSTNGTVFIDPVNLKTNDTYLSYYKRDAINKYHTASCGFDADEVTNKNNADQIAKDVLKNKIDNTATVNRSAGTVLRTYDIAVACTGEYTTFYGGTVAGALSGIVTSINRISGVFELEIATRLSIIANNDTLVFINGGTDPYSNNNGSAMLQENQTTINARIGSGGYDIGHVFSTWSGGGIAGLGVVCQNSQKSRGVTGSPSPVGDSYDIDYVSHEIGHQFGGSHTFNTSSSNCVAQRSGSTAYEPGSGITIMGYAGVCGADDLASHSIANFHVASFDQIQDYTTLSAGFTCPVTTATGNNSPISTLTNYHYDIPLNTPFKLTAMGSDPDGDTLTYGFEQYDLGPASTWNGVPAGSNAPIFMPYAPSLNNWRLFPKISNILNNVNSKGDFKPNFPRLLNFRMTLRDNRLNGGGFTYDDQTIEVNVVNTTVPFAITYPNTTGISWAAGSTQTITWDVAGTTSPPINTANVNIFLSTGGAAATYPFPVPVAANVPNTGSYTFVVPNNQTTFARVSVEAVGNIFLDINDKNFTITAPVSIVENTIEGESINLFPQPAQEVANIAFSGSLRGEIALTLTDATGRTVFEETVLKNNVSLIHTIDLSNFSHGIYFVRIDTSQGSIAKKVIKL